MTQTIQLNATQAAEFARLIYDNYSAAKSAGVLGSAGISSSYTPSQPVSGFIFVGAEYDATSNYYGEAWRNPQTNEIVVVSRGTVLTNERDRSADLNIAAGHVPPSADIALAFSADIASKYPDATIISIGHSKGGYEAQYANTVLTDRNLDNGTADRFAAFTFDAPAFGWEVRQQYYAGFGAANATNVIATTDPVSQLTFAAGYVLPGRTVAIQLTGVANDPSVTPQTCSAAAARAATVLDTSAVDPGSTNFLSRLARMNPLTLAAQALSDGGPWGAKAAGSVLDVMNACGVSLAGHSKDAMATTLAVLRGDDGSQVGLMSISDFNATYDGGGLRTQSVMSLTGFSNDPAFRKLGNVIVNQYVKRFGFGAGLDNPEASPEALAIQAKVEEVFASKDLTDAQVMDVGGTIYVRLANGEVNWVDKNGNTGFQRVTYYDDGSALLDASYPDGTTQHATLDTDGTVHTEVRDAVGTVIAEKTMTAQGDVSLHAQDPDGTETYDIAVDRTDQSISVAGLDADGKPVHLKSTETADGALAEETDQSGNWVSASHLQVDEHGVSTTTTTYPDGSSLSTIRNVLGQVTETRITEITGDTTVTRSYAPNPDGTGTLQSTSVTTGNVVSGYTTATTYPDGSSVKVVKHPDGTTETTGTAAPLESFGAAITDLNSLVQAIQSGKPLPLLNSGLHLLNNQSNPFIKDPSGGGTQTLNNQPLFTTTAVVSGIASLYNLHQAFDNGSDLDKISATAGALVAVNAAANAVASQVAGKTVELITNEVAKGALNTVGKAVPFLGAAVALEHGDYTGAAVSIMSAMNVPYVGWVYAGYMLLSSMTNEPPQSWATAQMKFADASGVAPNADMKAGDIAGAALTAALSAAQSTSTAIRVDVVGDGIGPGQVQYLMQGNGKAPGDAGYFGGLLGYLQGIVDGATAANPNTPLGLIPQRMPTLTWRESRQSDPGYALVDIDPLTGEQRYPALRYNDDGTPYNADATDPAQRLSLFQRMVDSALARQAIAPLWEVQTARLQQNMGNPDAGLTEEERAAHHGASAPAGADGKPLPGVFRPVVLDLGGDGKITTVANADTSISFDWNDSGYMKQTGWIGAGEGFLVLDRNANGTIDSGRELFSNGLVADAAKGVRSLAWVDANADGVIDASDPVFAAMRVWQDANQNGAIDAGEAKTLTDLGVTKLDYGNGRFTRDGQDYALQSPDLEASNDGVQIHAVQGGIQVNYSDGNSTLYVTQVTDLSGGSGGGSGGGTGGGTGTGSGNAFTVGNDGVLSWEDGVTPADPAHPGGQAASDHQSISIAVAQLLANDQFNGSASGLTLTSVGNAQHGSVVLHPDLGTVEFTPEHNYAGIANFDYTVTAPDGQSLSATVQLTLQAVNDVPEVTFTVDQRTVYGYGVLATTSSVPGSGGGGQAADKVVLVESGKGLPQYAPYSTVMGQTIRQNRFGDYVYGPLVDTGIPKDYFDQEAAKVPVWSPGDGSPPDSLSITLDGQQYKISLNPSLVLHNTPVGSETSNDGHLNAVDPDGTGQFKYELAQDGLYGKAVVDPSTGQFTYTGTRYVEQDLLGNSVYANVDTDDHSRYEETHTDNFTVKVIDQTDPTGNTFAYQQVSVTHFGPLANPNVASGGGKKPIAIDLNGDGFHFTDVDDSNVFYDVNGDGWRRKIAWNNPNDGFIAYDKNGDGKIDSYDELSFVPYKPDGQTDLEGLKAFDTNGDGVFSAADDKWASFGVWQDANSNGITDAGEFKSLTDLGIDRISLTSDGQFQVINGQTVHGTATATKTDGTSLAIADVTLRYKNVTQGTATDGTTVTANVATQSQGQNFTGTADADLVSGTSGNDQYVMGDGNDVVNDDLGNDMVDSGNGDDIVFTGAGKDYVQSGAGNDTVFTGDGDDLAIGGAGDDFLSLGSGNDVAFGGDGNDTISGGSGNDLLSGDQGDDKLMGEGGVDILFGMDGSDELYGGDGNDQLHGGAGDDLLSGGAGDDTMDGGLGNDIYEVDSASDVVTENAGEGFDTVRASISYTLGDNLEGLTLTGTAALTGTGNAADNVLYGNDGANTLQGLAGNDMLDGGLGADTLIGGTGDDTYVVDNAGDVVVEAAGEGTDTVLSRVSTTLSSNVENLTLTGIAAINGTGNALDNILIGNASANTLDGGAGYDDMRGGQGNDRYIVSAGGDLVTELAGEGYDTVIYQGTGYWWNHDSYTLTDNVEALQLNGNAVTGYGNALDNVITGGDGWQTLYGMDGNDRLEGGSGDDSLHGGNGDDVLIGGPATAALDAQGAPVSDNDLLQGGAGNDVLDGGAGYDSYVFARGDGADVVIDTAGGGRLWFDVGVGIEDLAFSKSGNDLVITLLKDGQATADSITLRNWMVQSDRVSSINFADWDGSLQLDESVLNVAPNAVADDVSVSEDVSPVVTGNVLANDSDPNPTDTISVANAGTYTGDFGTLTLNADGSYTYVLDNSRSDVQALAGGEQRTDVFHVDVVDSALQPKTASSVLTVTITGTNDAPQLAADTGAVDERVASSATGNVLANDSDVDAGTVLQVVGAGTVVGQYGTLVLGADGQYTYTLNADAQALRQLGDGAQAADVFSLTVADGTGPDALQATSTLTMTVTGKNDGPTVSAPLADAQAKVRRDLLLAVPPNAFADPDLGDNLTLSARLADGSALPSWLNFDPATGKFTGKPERALSGQSFQIEVTATDTHGSSISDVFVLSLNSVGITMDGTGEGDHLLGTDLDDTLNGHAGNDLLDGAEGRDLMTGGAGDDTYVVDDAGDKTVEVANEGHDTVQASLSWTLADNVEDLQLTGSADLQGVGNSLDNRLTGNAGANTLLGLDGNDVLDGQAGADRMEGGNGDDTYVVDNVGDVVVEAADAGNDSVLASISYALTSNVENLTLTGTANIDATGNELANTLNGNAGNNLLNGGAGVDVMQGGAGDDSYVVDNAGDQVVELADQGFDAVSASIDYVLPENVEQLTLTGVALRGTGNALNNLLFGNDEANVLDSGAGADQIAGGLGDDRYVVDNTADTVNEAAGAGMDTVVASVSYTLGANVENLILTGAGATNGYGNADANVLVGNLGDNTLSAGAGNDVLAGGLGNDSLDGGAGDDLYLYNQGEGRDVITDASGTDTLRFGAGITRDSVAGRTVVVNGQTKLFLSILGTDGTEASDQGVELAATVGVERFEFADGTVATLADLMIGTRTLNGDHLNNTITGDRRDETINAGAGDDVVYARTGNDIVYGGSGADKLFGEGSNDKLYGESDADQLWGGAGDDILDGGSGNDLLMGGTGADQLFGGAGDDLLDGGAGDDKLYGDSGSDQLFGGAGNDLLDGGAGDDLLASGDGNDTIHAGPGYDMVVAGGGDDVIDTGTGGDFVDAGDGNDTITTDTGVNFIAAGKGNDTINTGSGQDLIAFNRGDGADTVQITAGRNRDTVSLGGGIKYADLALRKSGNALVLDLGAGDSLTFKNWYSGPNTCGVSLLQMVTVGGDYDATSTDGLKNRKVVDINFEALANRFDLLRAQNPSMTSWNPASELGGYRQSSSDNLAIGGNLAYRYATTGSYGDMGWNEVHNAMLGLSAVNAQAITVSTTVNPWAALQAGTSLIADQTLGLPSPITTMPVLSPDELAMTALLAGTTKPAWAAGPATRVLS